MTNAIGLRCYLMTVHKDRDASYLGFDDQSEFELAPSLFLKNFVETNSQSISDNERERSWYFDPQAIGKNGSSKGYIRYGTFGFESNLVNTKTKKSEFRRKVEHVEEIPLFYEIWRPQDADYALAAFQSFSGRSCFKIVSEKVVEAFRLANPGYVLKFRKLVPNDGSGGVYAQAPVKQLRFIRRNTSSDVADGYRGEPGKPIDIELMLKARRMQSLGPFGEVSRNLKRSEGGGVIMYEGMEFSEAIASIKIGGKYRPVGVFGVNTDAGVIDITGDVKKGIDGHPLYDTIEEQVKQILGELNVTIGNKMR